MKKIIISLCLVVMGLPSPAVCSITGGACSFDSLPSNVTQQSLSDELVPNNLRQLQRTDAFQRSYQPPYYDMLLNTEPEPVNQTADYNSNCQFGVCLPGGEYVPEEELE